MSINVKPIGDSARKWAANAGAAAAEYQARALAAANNWAAAAAAAKATFKAGVSAPGVESRFELGIKRAGAAKFARKITDVGASRFPGGVAAAQSDYESRAQPYYQLITSLTLPPRQPRGSLANLERVKVIAQALAQRRMGQQVAA